MIILYLFGGDKVSLRLVFSGFNLLNLREQKVKIAITGCCEFEQRSAWQVKIDSYIETLAMDGHQVEATILPVNFAQSEALLKQVVGLKFIPFDYYYDLLICSDLLATFFAHPRKIFYFMEEIELQKQVFDENCYLRAIVKNNLQKHLSDSKIYTDSKVNHNFFKQLFGIETTYLPGNQVGRLLKNLMVVA